MYNYIIYKIYLKNNRKCVWKKEDNSMCLLCVYLHLSFLFLINFYN